MTDDFTQLNLGSVTSQVAMANLYLGCNTAHHMVYLILFYNVHAFSVIREWLLATPKR